ncbi:MAG: hypothetical protein IJM82_01080 [Synergistaceae bacterium]|nr:hypothetical protein [Synergistaceae bacterium]
MDRKNLEQYLGKSIEIMLMPDGHKTSGILLKCEEDHIALGNELFVYQMIWGVRPIENTGQLPDEKIPETSTPPLPQISQTTQTQPQIQIQPQPPTENIIEFLDELDRIILTMQENLETYTLNTEYVRRFRTKDRSKIQNIIESILTKYQYAVKTHEDRPYSMRMRELSGAAYRLWKANQNNIAASEIYAFVLYLTGESEKSVKIYMKIHDFHGAFMAANSIASKILAVACIIVSEDLNSRNLATLLKLEPPQLIAVLLWIINNVVNNEDSREDYKELCFNHVAAVSWKILGFSQWENRKNLFSNENINSLKLWLEKQRYDGEIINDALKVSYKENSLTHDNNNIDWATQRFEGEFDFFNLSREKLYGFIKCPTLKKLGVPLKSENAVFVHINQIQDKELRRKLLLDKRIRPSMKVSFKLGRNVEGPAAYEVREKTGSKSEGVLKVGMLSALSEEGEIDFYRRHDEIPFGKIRAKNDKKLYTFNEKNIIDPLLAVFLEYSPSAEGHPVRFTKSVHDNDKIQIHNVESAIPFPEDKIKAWEEEGLIQKTKERMQLSDSNDENNEEIFEAEITPEIEEIINRSYTPLEVYEPEKDNSAEFFKMFTRTQENEAPSKKYVETFDELPKFLQDKILSVKTAGKLNTEFLGDTFYRRGHYKEVKSNYLYLISKFNSEDSTLKNSERAERCFLIARYVYNFFTLADDSDIKAYSRSEEDNIRIMAYKGLEYLLYDQLDGAKKDESNYEHARRYCLLKIADEIQEARRIDENNTWLKIYVYSYFVNGLRFHNHSGKWSAHGISLSGSSLLESVDFEKFFEGLLTLAYVTEASLLIPTLKGLLYNPEYSGKLSEKLELDFENNKNFEEEIQSHFQNLVDEYAKTERHMLDPEVKLSPEIFRILSVQSAIIKLMKEELMKIFEATPQNFDVLLRKSNPILDSEEYRNSLSKTRRKYNPDAGLLDILPINVLGKIMGQYWQNFSGYFNDRPYFPYWKERFEKLQWVRNPVVHAHPEYVKKEDIEQVKSICQEITKCLSGKK